ncbi:MAG: D-sedoheptulose 7-phosphate isomerase, partial [Moritella dasanensis]
MTNYQGLIQQELAEAAQVLNDFLADSKNAENI